MKYDLSIIVPGIRSENFSQVYESANHLCKRHSFEVIFIGPKPPGKALLYQPNVRYVFDKGAPSRCLDLGIYISEGDYVTYTSDDTIGGYECSLDEAIEICGDDIVCIQYNEAPGFSNIPFHMDYWRGHHHSDLAKVPNTDPGWLLCIIFLMKKTLYDKLGGIDCSAEHINMNIHDLAFRHQKFGGKIKISPSLTWRANYIHRNNADPVLSAYHDNDYPWIKRVWSGDRQYKNSIRWNDVPSIWSRRFG